MSATLKFDGLTFDSDALSGLTLAKLTGWPDAPGGRISLEDRPQDDGAFEPLQVFRASKVVTVEGSYVGASVVDALQMRERLASMQAAGVSSTFVVADAYGSRSLRVLLETCQLPDDIFGPFFQFSFDVVAADPFKRGTATTSTTGLAAPGQGVTYPVTYPINFGALGSSGQAVSTNDGTAKAWPMFTVTGPMTGGFLLTHVESGRRIQFSRDIPDGSTVTVHSRTGMAFLNGTAPVSTFLTRTEWWPVPAKGQATTQFAALGSSRSPTLTVTTTPTYL